MSADIIENKVAASGLVTLDLKDFSDPAPRVAFDIKPWLFREMILREKDFREQVKQHNWKQYENNIVCFYCSADAIVPTWAYMLLAVAVEPFAHRCFFATTDEANALLFQEKLNQTDFSAYRDTRVIIKGCGDTAIPVNAFVQITSRLLPFAKSIMYGEACSNVPVYKQRVSVRTDNDTDKA